MTFRPSGVFAGKEAKKETLSRTNSSSNMFSMLSQQSEAAADSATGPKGSYPVPSYCFRLPSSVVLAVERRRIVLQPRTKPQETEAALPAQTPATDATEAPELTDEQAKKKIDEDVKEFFAVRSLDEADDYFTRLPAAHHHTLIDKVASRAIEANQADAQLVTDLLSRALSKSLCSVLVVEEGLRPIAEILYDIAIDAPKAPTYFADWVKTANLDAEACSRLAALSTDNDALLALLT